MASASPCAAREPVPAPRSRDEGADPQKLVRELGAIVAYITRMKQEIGALRVNELRRDRIPSANQELGTVVEATASATHDIMNAAEDLLGADDASFERYRALVETKAIAILEACSFQDITGQRISKVVQALDVLEDRLGRFAEAVSARDLAITSEREAAARKRRKTLMLNGPGAGIGQADIDKLFA
jgi:chemotaxis protein CheZ